MAATPKPTRRHYTHGYTFRWIQGESRVVVKRGYVIEGQSAIMPPYGGSHGHDRPYEVPGQDEHTWAATIPAPAAQWADVSALPRLAENWLAGQPTTRRTAATRR